MRTRRPDPAHQEAVSRRLALLSAELAASRPGPPSLADGEREVVVPTTPVVPLPGRHAARRERGSSLLPATLRGRVLLGPPQLAVVAVLLSLGLAVTAWWVVRADAEPTGDLAAAAPVGQVVPTLGAEPSADASAPATVTVDVAGKVRKPGIAVLDAGARVVDAIAAAGGIRPGAAVADLNLARVLVDGEQVLVGVPAAPGVAASATAGPGSAALVNLNTADAAALDTLPEVGPVTAESILAWREEHGGFASVDQLLEVDGIGEATLARIAPHVTV